MTHVFKGKVTIESQSPCGVHLVSHNDGVIPYVKQAVILPGGWLDVIVAKPGAEERTERYLLVPSESGDEDA